jgi:hypothetical protein
MSHPNSALAAWQLAVIAVVALGALAVWITAVYLADRQPHWRSRAAAGSPGEASAAETSATGPGAAGPGAAGEREPAGPGSRVSGSGDRLAA